MIYWGDPAPTDALFALYPFLPNKKLPLKTDFQHLPDQFSSYAVASKKTNPDFYAWEKEILKALVSKDLQKIVLARKTTLKLNAKPNPLAIAAFLKDRSVGSTVFCIQLPDKSYLVGATPERLFCRQNDQIQVEALAGTCPLGQEDLLLKSEKDFREFNFVEKHFEQKLKPFLASPLVFSKPTIHTTATLHHLKSIGKATLKPNVSDEELISSLHPTPALLGTPSLEALFFLKENEPFAREFYGGLIGWSHGASSDWKVIIRTCHLIDQTAHLYTGTGIVQGSDPMKEWNELNTKEMLYDPIFN